MKRLLALSWPERGTLLLAFLLVPNVTLALRLLGLRRLQALMVALTPDAPPSSSSTQALDLGRSTARFVTAAASRQPYSVSCLSRSLTLWWMLRLKGLTSDLCLGVRQEGGTLQAHAWVEMEGTVLNDSENVREQYATFDPIQWPGDAKWV